MKCKYWKLKEVYPISILPYSHYKIEIDINELANVNNCTIVRRSPKAYQDTFNDFGILREDIITDKDVPSLSMNLYGRKFNDSHLKYRCIGDAIKPWEGEKIVFDKYEKLYSILDMNTPIYFLFNDLHNKEFPYYKPSDKDTARLLKEMNLNDITIDGKFKLRGKTTVVHSPNKLNYWHVELKINDIEDNEIKSRKAAWQKSASEFAHRDIVTMAAQKEEPLDIYKIPIEIYTKKVMKIF